MAARDGHDPTDYEGFTRFHLELLERFREVAIDRHLDDGNLSGAGETPDVTYHETGVVDERQLLAQYDLPIVISIPTGVESDARTMGADETRLSVSVSAWVADYDQPYGLAEAGVIVGNIVNNVEQSRRLTAADGTEPLAADTTLQGMDFDFALNVTDKRHLKFATADFEVSTKRRLPR